MSRTESTKTTTAVTHVAKPSGKNRENGPHLADLRTFVSECEGLPDSLVVRIDKGYMGEGGRYDVTFRASWDRSPASSASATESGQA